MSIEDRMEKILPRSGTFRQYDFGLNMFIEQPRPIDMVRLSFLRWLAEQGKLEHEVAGPPSGSYLIQISPINTNADNTRRFSLHQK
jgi:hypothetical protein